MNVMPFVESSMMSRVEYDESTRELDVLFTSGKTYRYFDVSPDLYAGLLEAESKGQFFNEEIEDIYTFSEVRGRPRRR
jgi:hypothetical protein